MLSIRLSRQRKKGTDQTVVHRKCPHSNLAPNFPHGSLIMTFHWVMCKDQWQPLVMKFSDKA